MDEFSIVVLSLTGCVFAASAAAKIASSRAYHSFRAGLAETSLIPGRLLPAAAASLAGAEAVVAGGLLAAAALTAATVSGSTWLTESSLALAALLTSVLACGVAAVIRRGTRVRCACFGARSARPLGRVHLARNLSLLAVVLADLVAAPLAHGRPPLPGAMLAVMAGAVTALLFIRWDDIAALFARPPTSAAAPSARHRARRYG
jgi:hypothetical protein